MYKPIFKSLSSIIKWRFTFFLVLFVLAGCKKEPVDVTPGPDDPDPYPFLTYTSLVDDNSDWETLVTTSSEDAVNGYTFEGVFAGMYNKNFEIEIQGRSMNDQFSTGYRLKFDASGSNDFVFRSAADVNLTAPFFYKDPNNDNEYYTIGGGKKGAHTAGSNGGADQLYVTSSDDASIGTVYKIKVEPSSGHLVKTTENYYCSWDPALPLSMNNTDYTADFALCGTSRFDRNALFYSPAGLSNDTYLYYPPASDFNTVDAAGSSFHASAGFFNHQDAARFLGIHFRHDDNSTSGSVYNVTAKCYYPVNIDNTSFRASKYSGPFPVKSLMLEKEFLIMSDWSAELTSGRIKFKTLKTDDAILMFLDFYESEKIYCLKYNYVDKEFSTNLALQSYPEGFDLEKAILSPDGNIYFYNANGVYVFKNGVLKTIHDRSMFKDPGNMNIAYRGIAMKGDKLLLFVVKDLWVNSNNKFDFQMSTIIAKTTF